MSPTANILPTVLLPKKLSSASPRIPHESSLLSSKAPARRFLATPAGVSSASCLNSTCRRTSATATQRTGTAAMTRPTSNNGSSSGSSTTSTTGPTSDPPRPVAFLEHLYRKTERGSKLLQSNVRRTFLKPTPEAVDAYDLSVVHAVRAGDVAVLRTMLHQGVSFDASNRFGESIIHMACRRGDARVVRFLIDEAHVQLEVRDDFGRTPLHDALWTPKPNFDVFDALLRVAPSHLLLAEDIRGHTPFHYARKEHLDAWVKFLAERSDLLERKLQPLPSAPTATAATAISTPS